MAQDALLTGRDCTVRSPGSHGLRLFCMIIISLAATSLAVAPAAAAKDPALSYFQGLVGAAGFNEDQLTFADPAMNGPHAVSANDLSTMPYLGIAGQYALYGTQNHIGIDASLLFGWRSDDTTVRAGNGQAQVKIESDLWLVDLAIGLYAQAMLGNRWRLYGAAGPMLLFGDYSDDAAEDELIVTPTTKTDGSNSDTEFGVGGYAKLGLEYRLSTNALMGVAVRGIATTLEFDQAIDDGGLTGIQGFVTFTRAY